MSTFRIVQVAPLSAPFPFQVEERRLSWLRPWRRWHTLKQRSYGHQRVQLATARFHSLTEARAFIEHVQHKRAGQLAQKHRRHRRREQMSQYPQVVEQVNLGLS
ncbi:hypothetical protein [Hymenobacter sp. B81]|uniref:hypothetical protein n=1 Tax=Hymenobacter sp. B81 TaxID=3344878 RepID=UPI0037DD81D8